MNRDDILHRFETLLDEALESEAPPAGIDAELLELAGTGAEADQQCDSYALWAAVTALTQEVRLQGRAFRDLSESIASQADRTAAEIRAVYAEREREVQREAEQRARRQIVGALIDLRDRLARGLESASAAAEPAKTGRAGWLGRLTGKPPADRVADTAAALLKGYQLGLERLDELLRDFKASEILCRGQLFDPRRMNAIDLEESGVVPEGTVLEVYRTGYEWNGEVFRPAQVKVSRAPREVNQYE
jgi:molecular chaperone GrpE (heat shock protein)